MSKAVPAFRRVGAGDADFLFDLCEATMRGYVEQVWGSWNAAGVRAHLAEQARAGAFFALDLDGMRVGAVAFEQHDTHIQIEEMYIVPSWQNRGIGSAVVTHIVSLASREQVPVRLRVLASNPRTPFL
ncbi:GNAT family N-acetyltransferase [Variovorax sp. V512]|uniref:GNAT family N-acetyltransferase n=1 Tax=Variovorax sp. V512 TaxID=3064160 RepID=UPI0032E65E35